MRIVYFSTIAIFSLLGTTFAKGIFYDPTILFADAYLPALTHFEKTKIETTLRGFILRSDTQPGFQDELHPSHAGLYLNVAVRDPEEIPRFADDISRSADIITRTVEIPPTPADDVALRILLIYGSHADPKTISAIEKCIDSIEKKSEQGAAANP